MKRIPYAISDYEKLIRKGCYYVDKTMYLEKLEDAGDALAFLRPRRFGKTLLTSMMYYYYDINSKDKFEELFKDTYVYNNPTENKNSYYVLRLDFSGMNISGDINDIMKSFNSCLYIGIRSFVHRYKFDYQINEKLRPAELMRNFFSFFENQDKQNKIYLIIDEYDDFANGVLSGNVELFKNILSEYSFVGSFYSVIKKFFGTVIDRTFITGVTAMTFNAIRPNLYIVRNITNDIEFNSMLGFTYEEVDKLISELENKEEAFNTIKNYYDGYLFNGDANERVLNSTIVMYFVNNYNRSNSLYDDVIDVNVIPSYWKLKRLMELYNNDFYKEILDSLFYERRISGELKDYFNLKSVLDSDDIVSLLYYFGYIAIEKQKASENYLFKIPNKVMELVYNDYYLSLITNNNSVNGNKLDDAIIELKEKGNISLMCELVSDIIKNADNNMDFNERSVQLIFYALLAKFNSFDTRFEYQIKDKYIDLMIFKKKDLSNYDVMIEFKYIKKKEYNKKLLERLKLQGIEQLKEYTDLLEVDKNTLRKYIVIYNGSDVKVMEEIL